MEQDYYKNVTLSELKTKTIGGKTFYLATLETESEYGTSTYKHAVSYVWTQVSDRYIVKFEIDGFDQIPSAELDQILTITVSDN
jgi:hypothetical protein